MANDENVYGQWPRCGEIDCMEVMGQETNKAYGTIHYGNPHSESQGTYTIKGGADFSDDFHTFTCDWEPGKITWYVDGVKYHEESEWHSTTVGQGTLAYPAPFDQPFYLLVNLAIGGSFDLESAHPEKIRTLTEQLKRLDAAQLDSILRIVNGLVSNHPH